MALAEKYNLRDLRINKIMRDMDNCPTVDIDFIDYNSDFNPTVIFEAKHGNNKIIDLDNYQTKLQRNISDKLNIPYFILVYYPDVKKENDTYKVKDHWDYNQFIIIPANKLAKQMLKDKTKKYVHLSHLSFVKFRYKLNNKNIELIDKSKFSDIKINVPIPNIINSDKI